MGDVPFYGSKEINAKQTGEAGVKTGMLNFQQQENQGVEIMKCSKLVTTAVIIGAVFISTQSYGAEQKTPMTRMTSPSAAKLSAKAAIIPCPGKLNNVQLSINAQYSAPSGWTAKTTPTGYQGQTLVISMHQVLGGKLNCSYGKNGSSSGYRLTTVSRPVPAGKSCTAIDGFSFSCQ